MFFNVFLEGDHYGFLRLAEGLIIGAKTFIHSVEIVEADAKKIRLGFLAIAPTILK